MNGSHPARFTPFVAALAVATCLAVPAARADLLVSQFGHDHSADVRGAVSDARADSCVLGRGPTLFAARDEGRRPGRTVPAMGPEFPESSEQQVRPSGRIGLAFYLLFLFPQYPLAPHKTAAAGQPQGSDIPLFNFIDPAFGLKDSPLLATPSFSGENGPPLSEAPEPTALLSGVLGAALAGAFAGGRRLRRQLWESVRRGRFVFRLA